MHTPSEFILYQTEDGRTRIQCRFENETIWLSQIQIAELFQTTKQNIAKHLKAIFAEGELQRESVVNYWLTTAADGKDYRVMYYNLSVILAVGYRVRSHRGTQFRQWATERLGEYLLKGFTMDDERLKNPPGPGQRDYFEEQLERIRDIRSSERRFYQKILDIYATSIDYSANTDITHQFFATVQNKMHWAAHGQTAAEVIHSRVNAGKPLMGMQTTRPGGIIRKGDVAVAKNYLSPDELNILNHIVTLYLDFAELQAQRRKAMTMADWVTKLDDFLKLSDHELLDHAGKITAEQAKTKAELEYTRYRKLTDAQPRPVDADFDKMIHQLPSPPKAQKKGGRK
jgi:hypothetical protein